MEAYINLIDEYNIDKITLQLTNYMCCPVCKTNEFHTKIIKKLL